MSVPPEVEAVAVGWVLRARNDLKAAEYLLTLADGCPFDAVCFHAQQCAEKYLKALLTSHAVAFERTHNLRRLLDLCAIEAGLEGELPDLEELIPYAVEARYPGTWEPVTRVRLNGLWLSPAERQLPSGSDWSRGEFIWGPKPNFIGRGASIR